MTNETRAKNLQYIAEAARSIEVSHKIPMELTVGMCIVESGWLAKSSRNNCFGIKAKKDATDFQVLRTKEWLTQEQIIALKSEGFEVILTDLVDPRSGKRKVYIDDKFAVYDTLRDCFSAYADMLVEGLYFKKRFLSYLNHRSTERLLQDLSGRDGKPPYFTDINYISLWTTVTQQENVKAAILKVRNTSSS